MQCALDFCNVNIKFTVRLHVCKGCDGVKSVNLRIPLWAYSHLPNFITDFRTTDPEIKGICREGAKRRPIIFLDYPLILSSSRQ